jgi:dTDP-4-dehydrorhamnose 3,5-epimerase
MENKPSIIEGDFFEDNRGRLDFVNDFDLSPVKRFYFTTNLEINKFRGWQGHKIEKRWFYCVKGSFRVELIKMDNWENPSNDLRIESYNLNEGQPKVLYVPSGYLNGFLALEENSKMMILSDHVLGAIKDDEYRFASNKWRKIA